MKKPESNKEALLTADSVNELLSYDHQTGSQVWLSGQRQGMVAGSIRNDDYRDISIKNVKYLAHRVAWLQFYGSWPDGEIDHADGCKTNNAISNLRVTSRSPNNANKPRYKNNVSGCKGVHLHKKTGKWFAQIRKDGVKIYLGLHSSKEAAAAAYAEAAERLHKEFARVA